MKKLLLLLFLGVMVFSCEKEESPLNADHETILELREKPNCNKPYHLLHQTGNGDYVEICISCESYWGDPSDPEDFGHSIHEGDVVLSDQDGDGYIPYDCGFGLTGDCDDNDASVYPGAAEICGDGVDNDCDGYVDCEDPDCEGECNDDCDPAVNYFCDYLHYFDFDEPCTVEPQWGDSYCTETTPGPNFGEPPYGWKVAIWDNDVALNRNCGGEDPDYDIGVIYAGYLYDSYHKTWNYELWINLSLYDENAYLGEAFPRQKIFVDEATALEHAAFIHELAVANGLTDSCPTGPDL